MGDQDKVIRSVAIQKAIRTDLKAAVWECRIRRGMSVGETAAYLQISNGTVYSYLRDILAEAKETLLTDIERWKMEQTHRYDHIYGEAMGAWERSKTAKTSRSVKAVKPRRKKATEGEWEETDILVADPEDPDEVNVKTEEMTGDARYLNAAILAMQSQGKLWGFNAPEVSQVDARVLQVRLEGSNGLEAIKAAEEAYRAKRFIKAEVVPDGDSGDLQAESGSVVPELCEDHSPGEGEDTV